MEFREYLRTKREGLHLSLRQLGSLAGVSGSYLSLVEGGQRSIPSPEILRKLAGPLHVTYEQLLAAAGYLKSPQLPDIRVEPTELPTWLSSMPPDLQNFIRREAEAGWPYVQVIHDAQLNKLSPEDIRQVLSTLVDVKKRMEKDTESRKK